MTIIEALKYFKDIEIELLLPNILGKPKEFLYLNPDLKLTNKQTNQLTNFAKRRIKGEPIAYIIGYKYFYNLKFKVTKDTLIPRPETEHLIDQALKIIENKAVLRYKLQDTSYKILDIGTGSGCIAVSLAKHLSKDFKIHASDISPKALTVAKTNARFHRANIKFIHSNLFQNIKNKYDLIIANLPYVPISDYKKLKNNLKYEPKSAITDGTDQIKIYEKFFKQVSKHLNQNASILLEIDPSQKKSLPKVIKHYLPGAKTKFHKDLQKIWRYVTITISR